MKKVLVIIPTYDERINVEPITKAVLEVLPEAHLLFVDDNSPDGTGELLDEMATADRRVHVLHRENKAGLGRAYIAGFKWALEKDYTHIFEMDADFSHDPRELPNFLKASEEADLVLGSRYTDGIRVINWPIRRLLLSKGAAGYVRLLTGMPVCDPTGGFKCFRRRVLEHIPLNEITSNGYAFQIETTHTVWMAGFTIREIPIIFEDRRSGYSKMSTDITREAILKVWKLVLRQGLRRRPRETQPPPSSSC